MTIYQRKFIRYSLSELLEDVDKADMKTLSKKIDIPEKLIGRENLNDDNGERI